jgi:hypothetical protein
MTMSNQVSKLKSAALAALAVAAISGGTTALTTTSAEAQWRPGYAYGGGWGHRPARAWRPNRGAAVAAGIIGGIAAGALIAGARQPAYAAPVYSAPVYSAPVYAQPSYNPGLVPHSYAPAYGSSYGYEYQPTCYTRRVRQVVDYDTVVIRRVRVCE